MASTLTWQDLGKEGWVAVVVFDANGTHTIPARGVYLMPPTIKTSADASITVTLTKDGKDLLDGSGAAVNGSSTAVATTPNDRYVLDAPMTLTIADMASGTCTVRIPQTGRRGPK